MRILYYSQDYTPHDYRFLSKLGLTKHEVFYLKFESRPQPLERRPVPSPIKILDGLGNSSYRPGILGKRRRFFELKRLLRELQPDVLHAGPLPTCGFLAAATDYSPLLLMSWAYDMLKEAGRNFLTRYLTKYTLERAAVVCCDCQTVKEKILQYSAVPEASVVVFPWGVDLQTFKPGPSPLGLKKELGWVDKTLLISTRRMEAVYGIETVLWAFEQAIDRNPELRLLLVGTGSRETVVRSYVIDQKLEKYVHFAGDVSNETLPRYLNEADIYLSASYSDGTSVSLLEAMACGLPVIVTDIPSNREWVTPGVNGWLFPPGDSKALSKVLSSSVEPKSLLKEIAQKNLELARQRADWDKNFNILLQTYDRLAGARAK